MVNENEPQLNHKNIGMYAEAYKNRTNCTEDINKRINFDVLLVNGNNTDLYEESLDIYSKIKPGLASIIKIDDVTDPLREAPAKVADPLILFVQVYSVMDCAKSKMRNFYFFSAILCTELF